MDGIAIVEHLASNQDTPIKPAEPILCLAKTGHKYTIVYGVQHTKKANRTMKVLCY